MESKRITLLPSNVIFQADPDNTLLDNALNANVMLEHGCKNGSCGQCKAKLVTGEVSTENTPYDLTEQEINANVVLTCSSKPLTDCTIEADYLSELNDIKRQVLPAKVSAIDFPADDVVIINFRFPPTAEFVCLPGQYINLRYKNISRSYSIANSVTVSSGVELHIRHVKNGEMSAKVFSDISENSLVHIDGPLGSFFVRNNTRPLIFIAGGTGFAPVKAMVEELISKNDQRAIIIYWGAQDQSGLYSDLPYLWESQRSNITYIPVLSNAGQAWNGRKGLVHQAVLEDLNSLNDFDVYACGSPLMIEAARSDLIQKGLPDNQFYSDAFVAS